MLFVPVVSQVPTARAAHASGWTCYFFGMHDSFVNAKGGTIISVDLMKYPRSSTRYTPLLTWTSSAEREVVGGKCIVRERKICCLFTRQKHMHMFQTQKNHWWAEANPAKQFAGLL